MQRVKEKEDKKKEILDVAEELFLSEGYENASMRKIAQRAGISIGLVAYHYKSKRELALVVVGTIFQKLVLLAKQAVSQKEDPLLYSAVLIRLDNAFFAQKKYSLFYQDILKEDILTDVIIETGNETSFYIRDKYCPMISDEKTEQIGWYMNYISASMERTLTLYGKKHAMIQGDVAEFIAKSALSMWRFENASEEITRAVHESKAIVQKIMAPLT